MAVTSCGLCGRPARGFASIVGQRYCHEGESPTCYEKAQGLTSALLVDLLTIEANATSEARTARRESGSGDR